MGTLLETAPHGCPADQPGDRQTDHHCSGTKPAAVDHCTHESSSHSSGTFPVLQVIQRRRPPRLILPFFPTFLYLMTSSAL
jgi:hypothetical protein